MVECTGVTYLNKRPLIDHRTRTEVRAVLVFYPLLHMLRTLLHPILSPYLYYYGFAFIAHLDVALPLNEARKK